VVQKRELIEVALLLEAINGACISWRASRRRVVVTYGDLGRGLGWDGFRVSFGLVKEIV
jgi:hypothetical protein